MKKRWLALCLIGFIALSGCGGNQDVTQEDSRQEQEKQEQENTTDAMDEADGDMETEVIEEETEEASLSDLVSDEYYISPKNTGALQVLDGALCDMEGNKVQLKGVSTHGIARVENFLNPELFIEMRNDWGVNVIRYAMYIQSMDGYTKSDLFKEKNTQIMEKGIELATECDMYALVDWHVLDEKTPMKYVEESKEFFDYISEKYKDNDNLIYEICNEPNETEWSEIKEYANQVIPVIRANDPDAVIICGTPEWSQRVDQAMEDPLDFDNVMYTLHFYSASHKDELRNRMLTCLDAGFPIFVTEYGVTASSGMMPRDLDEADKWMEALDKHSISSCIWCLSKNGDACNLIVQSSPKFSGFAEEDFNDTGIWFLDMMEKYKGQVQEGQ